MRNAIAFRLSFFAAVVGIMGGALYLSLSAQSPVDDSVRDDAMISSSVSKFPGIHITKQIAPDEFMSLDAVTSGVSVVSIKFRPKASKARLMVGLQFTSRDIAGANLAVQLKDAKGNVLATHDHYEEVGPEKVVKKGHNLDLIRIWDSSRAIWMDFPKEAGDATEVNLRVTTAPLDANGAKH